MRTSFLVAIAIVAIQMVATPTMAALVGGFKPIENINDPHVQELGGWAVTEHVKTANDGLKFSKVVSGEVQVVEGTNYRLLVDVSDSNGKDAKYKAVVWERSWLNSRELLSFNLVN